MGVHSKSQETSIKIYKGQNRYDLWTFVFTAVNRPGGNTPGGEGATAAAVDPPCRVPADAGKAGAVAAAPASRGAEVEESSRPLVALARTVIRSSVARVAVSSLSLPD